jgi:dTMP kinase
VAEPRRQPADDAGGEPLPPADFVFAPSVPTVPTRRVRHDRPGLHVRLFGSRMYFRLWLAQVVSSFGDWIGFLAIAALAARIGDDSAGAAVGLVMSARIVPGFFFAAAAGVLVDRWDRKKVMVICDIGRGAVLATLPFVDTIPGLVLASLVLEIFTLLWSPAKEASVPNLVPADHLTTANSLSLVAAYGSFPFASAFFALLAKVAEWVSSVDALDVLRPEQLSIAFYVDACTFLLSACLIGTLDLPRTRRARQRRAPAEHRRAEVGRAVGELKEGWRFIFISPVVRSVMLGLGTGLIGGGMLVPLGPVFSTQVLHAGDAGFGLFVTALGLGVAVGIALLSAVQKRLPKAGVFTAAVLMAGVSLLVASSLNTLALAALFVAVLGVCAGAVYVLGFTILHENVEDELRGRIFSTLYTLVRLCVLLAFAVGPLLAELLGDVSDALFDGRIDLLGVSVAVPGVRLTLWLAGVIILAAGGLSYRSLQAERRREPVG